jgi:hypothetical protein
LLVGGLLAGVATPTELGGVIVLYAVLLGIFNRELDTHKIWGCMVDTFVSCGVIVFVIAASAPFAWIMAVWNLPQDLANTMMSLTVNKFVLLAILNAGLLILGCFLETAALLLISVPVLAPLLQQIGVDPVHFGIIIILNLMIGANTPPFGVILFVMIDVAKVPFSRYVRSFMPFYIPQVLLLILITSLPALSLWLPRIIEGDSIRHEASIPIQEMKVKSAMLSSDRNYTEAVNSSSENYISPKQPNFLQSENNSKNRRVQLLPLTDKGIVEYSAMNSRISCRNTLYKLPVSSNSKGSFSNLSEQAVFVKGDSQDLNTRILPYLAVADVDTALNYPEFSTSADDGIFIGYQKFRKAFTLRRESDLNWILADTLINLNHLGISAGNSEAKLPLRGSQ